MKTPASGHGHSHNVSTTSHPSSTPVAAPALGEDTLNFNSPAAMMMSSLGSHGLTPLPSGGDGLGIPTDLNTVSAGQASVLGTRNPEEDKVRRLQEVIKLLKTSVKGRGICGEGVERLAQLAGFTHMWQGDTLAIAGTCVDLEITFEGTEKDKATDVVLKIFTPEAEEHKKDASEALRSNLEPLPPSNNREPWRSLEAFATNLEHLGRMDHLSQGINCFEAIDGLYHTFRKIWEGEKERMGQRRTLDRLCRGNIGRPALNKKQKLGLSVEYWAERRHLQGTTSRQAEGDQMQLDQPLATKETLDDATGLWSACIDCESGYPSLRVSNEWISDTIWENSKYEVETTDEISKGRIAWAEPPPTLVRPPDDVNDLNAIDLNDAEIKIPKPPRVRFIVHLEPSVLVPLSVASSVLNRQGLSVALDDSKFTTYDQAFRNLAADWSRSKDAKPVPPIQRWTKSVRTFDGNGKARSQHHSYTLYSAPQIWCYPVQSVTFDHPKHLADLIPTLRQYVLLWTLLRSIVSAEAAAGTEGADRERGEREVCPEAQKTRAPLKKGITKKSNRDPRRAKVNALMREGTNDASCEALPSAPLGSDPKVPLPIDVLLSLTSSSPSRPKLDLIWPLPIKPSEITSMPEIAFGSVSIEVGPNGEIVVPAAAGISWAESEKGRRGIARAIDLGEDLGLLIEWIMEKQHA